MCASLVNFRQFAFELSCGQARVTDGQTDGQTDGRTQATTIPLRPDRPRGKNDPVMGLIVIGSKLALIRSLCA